MDAWSHGGSGGTWPWLSGLHLLSPGIPPNLQGLGLWVALKLCGLHLLFPQALPQFIRDWDAQVWVWFWDVDPTPFFSWLRVFGRRWPWLCTVLFGKNLCLGYWKLWEFELNPFSTVLKWPWLCSILFSSQAMTDTNVDSWFWGGIPIWSNTGTPWTGLELSSGISSWSTGVWVLLLGNRSRCENRGLL